MRSTILASAVLLAGLQPVIGQTFTDCNPLDKTCPSDASLGASQYTDFRTGESSNWEAAIGTTPSYDPKLGIEFTINKVTDAPTMSTKDYIFFGRVSAYVQSSPGTGTVSSFILESDDLDEIDWEWLGSDDARVESNFFGKGNTTAYDRAAYHPVGADPISTFHNYTILWTAESIQWLIDGNNVRTLAYGDALALGGKNYPQTPMKVKMGSWVGCANASDNEPTSTATYGTCQWAGGPIDISQAPFTMYVQWVDIENYGTGCEYTYSDNSGSYQSITQSGTCSNGTDSSGEGSSSSSSSSGSSSGSSTGTSSGASSTGTSTQTSNGTSTGASTLTKVSSTGTSSTGTGFNQGSTTTTGGAGAANTASAGNTLKPKHEYGMLDLGVMALGLGLGYLVM